MNCDGPRLQPMPISSTGRWSWIISLTTSTFFCRYTSRSWKKQKSMTTDCWVQSRNSFFVTHLGIYGVNTSSLYNRSRFPMISIWLFLLVKFSPGSWFFLPNGTRIYNKLMEFIKNQYRERGYKEVTFNVLFLHHSTNLK